MFRTLRKAASSLEKGLEDAFSTPPPFVNRTLRFGEHGPTVRLGAIIAEGGFSFIHVASEVGTGRRFAVKRAVHPAHTDAASAIDAEIAFLSTHCRTGRAPHNVVAYHGHVMADGSAFLLFDLVDGGTLAEVLRTRKRLRGNTPLLLSVFADIVAGVCAIQAANPDRPLAVRDVKLENVLYDRVADVYKLCDFGSVSAATFHFQGTTKDRKLLLDAEQDIAQNCTNMYRAPEAADLYAGHPVYEKVDVWALGCILYALLFGRLPFDETASVLQIANGVDCDKLPKHSYPAAVIDMLRACFIVDPVARPDCFGVLRAVRSILQRLGKSSASGTEDGEFADAARRIRQLRQVDFGQVPAAMEIGLDFSDLVTTKSTNTNVIANNWNGPNTSNHQKASGNDDNWADFSSAFDSNSTPVTFTQSFSAPIASSSAPRQRLSAAAITSAATSNHTDNSQSLIDFSDVPVVLNSSRNQQTSRQAHADDETDLMDIFK